MIGRISSHTGGAALLLMYSLNAAPACAQEAPLVPGGPPVSADAKAEAAEAAEAAQDEILVTAHRQHGAVATDIPPEVSFNATVIQSLGAADLQEVFAELAPEIGSGPDRAAASAGAPIVLVNGQRIAGFSSIRDLPPEAVRRIEIFPPQVALQYGYGADQRVVNVVLRRQYRALTVLGRYTFAPQDWRGVYQAKVDLVRIGENSHWNLDIDYRHQDAITADTTLSGEAMAAGDTMPVPRHTLAAQNDHLTMSGAATRVFGAVSAEVTGSLDLQAVQSRPGLSEEDGDLLAQEGLSNLITGPLSRIDRTVEAQTSLTLNGKIESWRWSFIGKLDDSMRDTRTGAARGTEGLDPILLPSPTLLGRRCRATDTGCVSTETRQAGADAFLNGNLFALPAGAVTAALRSGFVVSDIRSASPLMPLAGRSRDEGSAQANLDVPITARGFALGKLTVGINGAVRALSDFGTLTTIGSTVQWSPVPAVNVLASFRREQQAPSLLQLGEAALDTPDLREYDFATGTTTIVQRTTGGNGDLERQVSRIADVRLQVTPIRAVDLTLSADYMRDRDRNPIASLTAATPATMAAFPDRFTRANFYLTALDVSPVNLARRDRQQVRFGLTYSTAFGAARPAGGGSASVAQHPLVRNQFQIALYDTWHLQDDVVLRTGQPRLDLLDGGIISDGGGTPAHQIELQTTVATDAWSIDLNAAWQSPTMATAGALSQDQLIFSQGITLNMRLRINLADQPWLTRRIPWLRGNLNLSADNLLGAHTKVHDAGGIVPAAYSETYVNPTGRTFRITLRKHFR